MITQDRLQYLLDYNPDTGIFTRVVGLSVRAQTGKPILTKDEYGYIKIRVDHRLYLAHRLAFLYMTGEVPEVIDHINGIRDDNRWCNLREATRSQNQMNRVISKNNTSGYKNVNWNRLANKWEVSIKVNNKRIYLGQYSDLEEAAEVAQRAREKYHGEYSNNG